MRIILGQVSSALRDATYESESEPDESSASETESVAQDSEEGEEKQEHFIEERVSEPEAESWKDLASMVMRKRPALSFDSDQE